MDRRDPAPDKMSTRLTGQSGLCFRASRRARFTSSDELHEEAVVSASRSSAT
jgi:hypothetical protein